MFNALENKCIEQIENTKKILQILEDNKGPLGIDRNEIKRFIVSSCVTRLYAIYEYFVDTILSDYLDALSECIPFNDLSSEFKKDYRNGISNLLGKIDRAQYSYLKSEDVIKWYYEALTNQPKYKFVTQALVMHEQNLRLNIVESLFSRIEVKEFRNWINRHRLIRELYPEGKDVYLQLESELSNFIQIRNDASHGLLDDLEGRDSMLRFCELISTVIIVFTSFLRKSILLHHVSAGRAHEIGQITEVFKKSGSCILIPVKGVKIKVGNQYCLVSNSDCFQSTLGSIMLEGTLSGGITAKADGLEIGVRYCAKVSRMTTVYAYA